MSDNVRLENDVYTRCLSVAKSYYPLLRRRQTIEEEILQASPAPPDGMPRGSGTSDETASKAIRMIRRKGELDRQIRAIEQAWAACTDQCERDLIKRNLFERIPMSRITLPLSERTMQRYRHNFVVRVAENLLEV